MLTTYVFGVIMVDTPGPTDPIQFLRADFRHQLDVFYATLKLAPPYDHVEKAIGALTLALKALPQEDRARIVADRDAQWQHYHQAFVAAGLQSKHRGIIAGLARSRHLTGLPAEHQYFLKTYLT